MSEKTWVVYTLADSASPEDVRYVGITANPQRRLRDHKRVALKTHKGRWVASVLRDGRDIVMAHVFHCPSQYEANEKEVELIAQHRSAGARLTNSTKGGEGVVGKTQEVLDKMSAKAKERMTPEVVETLQAALRRPEVIARKIDGIRAAMTPDVRRRIGDAQRGKTVTAETRMKISAACKGRTLSADEHGKLLAAQRRMATRGDNTSGYRGVSFDRKRGLWYAYINADGSRKSLGRYASPIDAAIARDLAAKSLYGDDCFLNIPPAANDNHQIKAMAA